MKREIPLIITFVAGAIIVLDYFFSIGSGAASLAKVSSEIQNWTLIVSAFALAVASVNLLRIHLGHIRSRKPGWHNSLILVGTLCVMTFIGIWKGTNSPLYRYWYTACYVPVGATVFSLLAFYITSAAYRAFRARNTDATILLVTAFVVMMGVAPIGEFFWDKYPSVTKWIMDFPNNAGQRGIILGAAVGAVSLGLRMLVGFERSYLGSD